MFTPLCRLCQHFPQAKRRIRFKEECCTMMLMEQSCKAMSSCAQHGISYLIRHLYKRRPPCKNISLLTEAEQKVLPTLSLKKWDKVRKSNPILNVEHIEEKKIKLSKKF